MTSRLAQALLLGSCLFALSGTNVPAGGDGTAAFYDPAMELLPPAYQISSDAEEKAIVLVNKLNLRKAPEAKSEVQAVLELDQVVTVQERNDNGWFRIAADDHEGWVAGEFLRFARQPEDLEKHPRALVQANALNVRALAGTDYRVIHRLSRNDLVTVISDPEKDWVEVEIPDEHLHGWVASKYLRILPIVKASRPANAQPDYAVVKSKLLNVRSGPGRDYPRLQVLRAGMHVSSAIPAENGWRKIVTSAGITGWVAQRHLRFYEPVDLPSEISETKEFTSPLEAGILSFLKEAYEKGSLAEPDKLSMVVHDLQTGERLVSIRADEEIKAASMIKVPLLQAYMLQRYRGEIRHTPSKQKALSNMIRFSSNSDTNKVMKWLGGPEKVQKILDETNLYQDLKVVEYIPRYGKTYQNKLSANDLNRLMITLWSSRVLGPYFSQVENEKASEEMLYLMGQPGRSRARDRLKDGTCYARNPLVKVWDKTGFVKGVNGNTGIVEIDTPEGRRSYTVVMALDRRDFKTIAGNANRWSYQMSTHMRRISELVYSYMSIRYNRYNECNTPSKRLVRHASNALQSPDQLRHAL
jgi:beta-lactamase class A